MLGLQYGVKCTEPYRGLIESPYTLNPKLFEITRIAVATGKKEVRPHRNEHLRGLRLGRPKLAVAQALLTGPG